MSQKKVDEYKENKKNRKEIIAKEKRTAKIRQIVGYVLAGIVVVGLVAGIGVTIYNSIGDTTETDYRPTSFILNDFSGIRETEEAE